jgi:ATP-binding cassette subfamily B protein/subfamily B ATP-binding cassette protein MsbA
MWIQIKRLLLELKPYRNSVIIIIIAGIAMSLAQWQLAVQLKDVFDSLDQKNKVNILALPKKILLIAAVMALGRYFHLSVMNYTADRVVVSLRSKLQIQFMNLSQSFHNNYLTGSGGMISRILTDVVIIQHGMRLFADFFTQPLSFVLLIGTLFYRDWKLTCIILLFLPLIVAFSKQIGRSLRKYGHGGQEILEKLTSLIKESLDGVKVIQSYCLEKEMDHKFHLIADEYLVNRKKMHTRGEAASPVTEFLSTSVVMVIFTYIGLEISKGQASLGDFGSYLGALFLLQSPIKKIQESFVKIQETVVALERVYSIIDNEYHVPEWVDTVPFPRNWSNIEFKNVSFTYKNNPVLQNINLEIKKGDILAIVGESGSGKSTLVNLLQRFFDPNQGQILIEGIDIKKFALNDLRMHIGLVTQDVFLFNETIGKNIHNGDLSKDESGVVLASVMANAHGFITKMPKGFGSVVGDRGSLLSGGERQRVSIARALFKNAPILVLDEATSALDTASEIEVQKGLDTLMHGKTTVVIAHRLSTVLHANKIVVMKKGQIIEQGNHQELMTRKGEYARYIELQNLK